MYDTDEESIFTYAKYLESLTIMRVNIDELREEIVCHIFQTWNVRVPVPSINLHIEDLQGNSISLQGRDSVHKVLCSFRPGWFREQVQPSLPTFDGPDQAYLLRLECTGTSSDLQLPSKKHFVLLFFELCDSLSLLCFFRLF